MVKLKVRPVRGEATGKITGRVAEAAPLGACGSVKYAKHSKQYLSFNQLCSERRECVPAFGTFDHVITCSRPVKEVISMYTL